MYLKEESFSDTIGSWACFTNFKTATKARQVARYSLIDTLACMLIGSQDHQSFGVMEALSFGQEHGVVQPIGGGVKLTTLGAAVLNGVRAHAIDFDDYEFSASTHPSAPIFAALFSLAKTHQFTLNQIFDAWTVGYETLIWLGRALGFGHYNKGWHATATLSPIGTAAAASKLLNLSAKQISNAMAIAASSSAGSKAQFGFDTKALHVGFAAEAGLRAALLARSGLKGNKNIWQSSQGFTDLYGTKTSIGFSKMMKNMDLGEAVNLFPVARKLWPSCSYTHRAIWGAENLYNKLTKEDEITKICIRLPKVFHRVSCFNKPQNAAEARFSVSYCAVAGLLTGHVTPDDFLETSYKDPKRQKLTQNVIFDLYDLPTDDPGYFGPSTAEKIIVTLSSGRSIEIEVSDVPGGANIPATQVQILKKLEDCGGCVKLAKEFFAADGTTLLSKTHLLD